MALTLTQTAVLTKKAFIFGVIFVILAIFAFIGIQYYIAYQKSKVPPFEPKPDVKFNLLPKPQLEESLADSSKYSYELVTKTGNLPTDIPKLFKVYFIPKLGTTLLAPAKAKELAEKFNFDQGPQIISSSSYAFTDENDGAINIDLETGNFNFSRKVATESASASSDLTSQDPILPDQAQLAEEFKQYLLSKDLLSEILKNGRTKIVYSQGSQQDSNYATISLWQDDIKDGDKTYPIVTAKFTEGLIKAQVTKYQDELNRYLGLNYIIWTTDPTSVATYPIKAVANAYRELQEGKGTVVIKPDSKQISISNVYLAYLVSEEYTQYLQPVFVFEGDNFAALIPAITDQYLEK